MAEWGNNDNQRYGVDMDSNGQKLKVRNTSGAYEASDFRVEIEETTDSDKKALKVRGKADIE